MPLSSHDLGVRWGHAAVSLSPAEVPDHQWPRPPTLYVRDVDFPLPLVRGRPSAPLPAVELQRGATSEASRKSRGVYSVRRLCL